ncbi:MAG: DUF4129 domain-containing protein, partial [Burkholderiales bacterium]|nr:DUF4129 domain-containing protein [Phycisphaerae bacterium]
RLERRKISRSAHMTPMEFSRSVGFLPGEWYSAIQRLTRVFYRVRYGGRELNQSQQARLMRVVDRIDTGLGPTQ